MTGLTDPFALQVHRPLAAGPDEILPLLPPYVRRKHDDALAAVVAASVDGASRMAVLVGGSSTGKTRACWEAVTASSALPGWRLWYPYDPTPPEGLLEGLPRAGPRTVIWLDDAQLYLQHSLGERAASALRTVLGDRRRAPVLVLGTMWPEYWNKLTSEAGSRRTLLEGTLIHVPDAFTCAELDVLRSAADPRLAAASTVREGRVTQFLAGAPILLERYQTAEPPARAVIEAAMDARRLGYGQDLPLAFLANAAPGYMTDSEWDAAGDAWLEQALAYTAEPAKGAAGPVGPTRSRPSSRGRSDSSQPNLAPSYRLADYLDEHGRKRRVVSFPPDGFWEAAAVAPPDDQVALAWSAERRSLSARRSTPQRRHLCRPLGGCGQLDQPAPKDRFG